MIPVVVTDKISEVANAFMDPDGTTIVIDREYYTPGSTLKGFNRPLRQCVVMGAVPKETLEKWMEACRKANTGEQA